MTSLVMYTPGSFTGQVTPRWCGGPTGPDRAAEAPDARPGAVTLRSSAQASKKDQHMSEATTTSPSPALLEELDEVNARLETAPAGQAISWALDRFGDSIALACSFQDIVVVDLVRALRPSIEVVFLDTGAHFAETLRFVAEVTERYALNLTVTHPGEEAEAFPCGSDRCCEFRKVAPRRQALVGRAAWMTGLK